MPVPRQLACPAAILAGAALLAGGTACAARQGAGAADPVVAAGAPAALRVPVEYYRLPNGLKVVLSEDRTSPTVTVAAYYNIGFRIEPRDRTGFAHLFEHMMFQGSNNLGKMEFIRLVQQNGGVLNGSTRFDHTNYYAVVPAHKLETMLWAEADRMRGLKVTQENLTNQQGVVKNEVRVNVLNQPYGGFPWLDVGQAASRNWFNSHNWYGELEDLDAATLSDVQSFFDTFYVPNNAVLVVVGDFERAQARRWVEQYFGVIRSRPTPPKPDIAEPRQAEERRATREAPRAPRPAFAVAYHAPPRNTPEYWAMGILDQVLVQGRDSRLNQALVQRTGLTGGVGGGINFGLGNMYNIAGPTLWMMSLFHDRGVAPDSVLRVVEAEVASLRDRPLTEEELDRARTKLRSDLYANMEQLAGFGRADLLASFALFDDDPDKINRLEEEFRKVTPALVQRTAQEYLRPTNRTVYTITVPAVPAPPAGARPSGN